MVATEMGRRATIPRPTDELRTLPEPDAPHRGCLPATELSLGRCDDAAIYFDINRRGDLAEHIEAFLQAPEQDRNDLITRGRERAKLFSWEESARKLKQVYDSIL